MSTSTAPNLTRRRPRSYLEWSTLRSWGKLPEREALVPGFLLRYAREEAKITQADLAKTLRVTQQAVAQAERWDSNPTIALIKRWADACNHGFEFRLFPA